MTDAELKKAQLISLFTIIRREIRRFTRIWVQTLLPPIITTSLYFIIFGSLIGKHVPAIGNVSYIDFMVPGLVMMAVINNSYSNVVSSFFSAKFQRFIDELLVSLTPSSFILLGYVFGGVLRGMLIGFLVLLVASFFTDIHIEHIPLMLIVMFLTSLLFSAAGLLNAIFAKNFDEISIIPTFILTPLTYLGGVFYSITLLPGVWQTVSLFNPMLYMIDALRFTFLGISDIPVIPALSVIILANIALLGYAYYLLESGRGLRE